MADVRTVTDAFSVAPQLNVADVSALKAQGVALLINNRPDGEAPDQPDGAQMEAAARAAGMDYLALPVRGGPTAQQAESMRQAIDGAQGPVLAFCRSGTRSITAWAMGRVAAGDDRTAVLGLAQSAGYDLSGAI